jgi:hypothetical protein
MIHGLLSLGSGVLAFAIAWYGIAGLAYVTGCSPSQTLRLLLSIVSVISLVSGVIGIVVASALTVKKVPASTVPPLKFFFKNTVLCLCVGLVILLVPTIAFPLIGAPSSLVPLLLFPLCQYK